MQHTQDWHDGYDVGCAATADALRENLMTWLTDKAIDMRIGLCDNSVESLMQALREAIRALAEEQAEAR